SWWSSRTRPWRSQSPAAATCCRTAGSSSTTRPEPSWPPTTSGALTWAKTDSVADLLSILPQQLVFGLALGTVYGLIALGYTMVYGILFMINFAHGEIFMIGAYLGWGVLSFLLNAQIAGLHAAWVVPLMLLQA